MWQEARPPPRGAVGAGGSVETASLARLPPTLPCRPRRLSELRPPHGERGAPPHPCCGGVSPGLATVTSHQCQLLRGSSWRGLCPPYPNPDRGRAQFPALGGMQARGRRLRLDSKFKANERQQLEGRLFWKRCRLLAFDRGPPPDRTTEIKR